MLGKFYIAPTYSCFPFVGLPYFPFVGVFLGWLSEGTDCMQYLICTSLELQTLLFIRILIDYIIAATISWMCSLRL